MNRRMKQWAEYCKKTGMADTIFGFALWNRVKDLEEEVAMLRSKYEAN